MRNRIFHTATINGECFYGLMKPEGLYVVLKRTGGNAPIGEAELRFYGELTDDFWFTRRDKPGWWMVKYRNEPRIDLHQFSIADIKRLSSEFGILIFDDACFRDYRVMQEYFYTSPAWDGLRKWVCSHPRLADTIGDSYCSGWRHRMAKELEILRSQG